MHPTAALIRDLIHHYAVVRHAQQRVARCAGSATVCAALGGDPEHAATVADECREADADRARQFAELLAVHDRLMASALVAPPLGDIPGEPNPRAWLNQTRLAVADILRHANELTGRHRRADGREAFHASTPPGKPLLSVVRILKRAADLIDAAVAPGTAGQTFVSDAVGTDQIAAFCKCLTKRLSAELREAGIRPVRPAKGRRCALWRWSDVLPIVRAKWRPDAPEQFPTLSPGL